MEEKPLFLRIVGWFISILSMCCVVIASPILLSLYLTTNFVTSDNFLQVKYDHEKWKYLCWFFPRWIVTSFTFVCYLAESIGLAVLGYMIVEGGVRWFLAVVFGLAGLGIIHWAVHKTSKWFPSFQRRVSVMQYAKAFGESQLDFLAAIAVLLCAASVIRLPHLRQLMTDSVPRSRYYAFLGVPFIFLDILTLPFFLLSVCSPRYNAARPETLGFTKEIDLGFSHSLRVLYLREFFLTLHLYVSTVLLLLLVATPWRLPTLPRAISLKKSQEEDWMDKLPHVFWRLLFHALLDILAILGFTLILCTFYRLPNLIRKVRGSVAEARLGPLAERLDAITAPVLECSLQLLIDLPFLIMGIICFVTLTRAYPLFRGLRSSWTSVDDIRETVWENFQALFFDFIDLPFYIIGLILCSTGFRAYQLVKDVQQVDRCKARKLALVALLRWFIDLFAALAGLFVLVTLWRAPTLVRRIHNYRKKPIDLEDLYFSALPVELRVKYQGAQRSGHNEADINARLKPVGQVQLILFQELLFFFLDVPFMLLYLFMCLTVFRARLLVTLLRDATDDWERRKLIALQFLQFLLDIPALISVLILSVSWRSFSLWRQLSSSSLSQNKHKLIFREFAELFIDIPFLILSCFSMWRFPQLIRALISDKYLIMSDLVDIEIDNNGRPHFDQWIRRKLVARVVLETLKDIPCLVSVVLMTATVWRLFWLIPRLKRRAKKPAPTINQSVSSSPFVSIPAQDPVVVDVDDDAKDDAVEQDFERSYHMVIVLEFLQWCKDIPCFIVALLLGSTGWRLWVLHGRVQERARLRSVLQEQGVTNVDNFKPKDDLQNALVLQQIHIREIGVSYHQMMAEEFGQWLIDLPFFALAVACLCIAPWRIMGVCRGSLVSLTGMWRELSPSYREMKYFSWKAMPWERRQRVMAAFGLGVLDHLAFAVAVLLMFTWRAPTLWYRLHHTLQREEACTYRDKVVLDVQITYIAVFGTFVMLIGDIIFLAMLVFTLGAVFQIPSTVANIVDEIQFFRNMQYAALHITDYELDDNTKLHIIPDKLLRSRSPHTAHRTLLAHMDYANSMHPHYMVHALVSSKVDYLGFRPCVKEHGLHLSFSILHKAILKEFFRSFSWGYPMYLKVPIKLIARLLGFALVIGQLGSMLFLPLMYPAEKFSIRTKDATALFSIAGLLRFMQVVTFPIIFFGHIFFIFLPFALFSLSEEDCTAGNDCLRMFFDNRLGERFEEMTVTTWTLQGLWWLLVVPTLYVFLFHYSRKHMSMYRPFKSFKWLVYRIFMKKVYQFYKRVFEVTVHWCYLNRKRCFIGEILYMPAWLIWTCWPVATPLIHAARTGEAVNLYAVGITAFITIALIRLAKVVTKQQWQDLKLPPPKLQLTDVRIEFSDPGIRLLVKGTKPSNFTFSQATFNLEGEQFWSSLYSILKWPVRAGVRVVRTTSLPMEICPKYLKPSDFKNGQTEFETVLDLGTDGEGMNAKLSKYLITKRLRKMRDQAGDTPVDVVFRYSCDMKANGVNEKGHLASLSVCPSLVRV